MNDAFQNDIQVSFDSSSRSGRWEDMRTYLKQLIQTLDANSDRLAYLQSEIEDLREANLKTTETIQALCDAANEEVQREVSLTLNDDASDVVVDIAPEEQTSSETPSTEEPAISEEDFIHELMKLPGVGAKSSLTIANHIAEAQADNVLRFAYALRAVNADLSEDDSPYQPTLNLD